MAATKRASTWEPDYDSLSLDVLHELREHWRRELAMSFLAVDKNWAQFTGERLNKIDKVIYRRKRY